MNTKYVNGFVISLIILITGLVWDAFFPPVGFILPKFPGNLILLFVFLLVVISVGFILRKLKLYNFLISPFVAVPAISVFTILVILMGIIPQGYGIDPGFINNIKSSWTFYLVGIFLFMILVFSSFKRLKHFNNRNIAFILNHLGIAVILLAGGLGQTDKQNLIMNLKLDEPVWYASDHHGKIHELDFALEMKNFSLDYHNPLLQIESTNGKVMKILEICNQSVGQVVHLGQYKIIFEEYFPEASKLKNEYVSFESMASVAAVSFSLLRENDTVKKSEWVANGSHLFKEKKVVTQSGMCFSLMPPMPKQYTTESRLYKKDGSVKDVSISVNNPAGVNGWKLYQQSYDERQGKHSKISVIGLVKDPWLPLMYFGIFNVLAGVVVLFVSGKSKTLLHE